MTKAESSKSPLKPEPKLQTITLKAFIHCEGCRRKIRRIIRVLDGVEDVVVDSATGKVTVVGSDIDVKTVLQRLQKYGKRAEIWPTASAGPPAMPRLPGGEQLKPANLNGPAGSAAAGKKKANAGGEGGGENKPLSPAGSEAKKGAGKNNESPGPNLRVAKEQDDAISEFKPSDSKPERKQVDKPQLAEARDGNPTQGNEGNSGGGGKKGKKGGNGANFVGDGPGVGAPPEQLLRPPPAPFVRDVPITNVPVASTVTVSANRGPSPYDYIQTGYSEYNSVEYATTMFSDENANNCSIM